MTGVQEKWREYSQGGMGGEKYQGWFVTRGCHQGWVKFLVCVYRIIQIKAILILLIWWQCQKTERGDGGGRAENAQIFLLEVTGMDRIQNDSFRGMAQVVQFGERTGDKIVSKLCRRATVEKYTIFQFWGLCIRTKKKIIVLHNSHRLLKYVKCSSQVISHHAFFFF